MKRPPFLIECVLVLALVAVTSAQWQVNPREETRVEPIYPTKPYSFQQTPPAYDPFQFNWSSGRWDYAPIPYESPAPGETPSPYRFNWYSGRWDYRPWGAAPGNSAVKPDPSSTPRPDDSTLWIAPTTRPHDQAQPKVAKCQGYLVGMRAVSLAGAPRPELLIRVRDVSGKTTSVDVGHQLQIPESAPSAAEITATGISGDIDGSPVLFADHITIGDNTQEVVRDR